MILRLDTTARNVISITLGGPRGACRTIGPKVVLGDFSVKSSFWPSQTSDFGRIMLYSKKFEKYFFH